MIFVTLKKTIVILFLCFSIGLVLGAFYKIIKRIYTHETTVSSILMKPNERKPKRDVIWNKPGDEKFETLNDEIETNFKQFQYIPMDKAQLINEVYQGHEYTILKYFKNNAVEYSCNLGKLKYSSKNENGYFFISHTKPKHPNFDEYVKYKNKPVFYKITEQEPQNSRDEILPCDHWVNLENVYAFEKQNHSESKNYLTAHLKFKKGKCAKYPETKLLSAISYDPNILHFKFNHIKNHLEYCTKKSGRVLIKILSARNFIENNILIHVD